MNKFIDCVIYTICVVTGLASVVLSILTVMMILGYV